MNKDSFSFFRLVMGKMPGVSTCRTMESFRHLLLINRNTFFNINLKLKIMKSKTLESLSDKKHKL